MNESTMHSSDSEQTQLLWALQQEIQTAVQAICGNALNDFELSLWRQEMLCGRLKRNIAMGRASMALQLSNAAIGEALTELKATSDCYEKVVLRCSKSAAVLQDLCRLYRGAAAADRRAVRSLSCEV